MKVEIREYMVPNQSTITGPLKYNLELIAEGTAREVDWYAERLKQLGVPQEATK